LKSTPDMMANKKDVTIKDVMKLFFYEYKNNTQYNEMRITKIWQNIVGPHFVNHTVSIGLRNKTLYVRMDSASAKYELYMGRNLLIKHINLQLGEKLVDKIMFQ
jgi:predicted nucleic acid-binding Zn ribbon protein